MQQRQEGRSKRLPVENESGPYRRDYGDRPQRGDADHGHRRNVEEPRPRRHDVDQPRRRAMPALKAAQAGLDQVADLTGRETQGVVSLEPADGGWVVGVEVVEDRRIPSSTDVLALYEAKIDEDGELVAYTRKRRYVRGKSDSGELGR
jgi:Gas vesicle synthesis protein GvpO